MLSLHIRFFFKYMAWKKRDLFFSFISYLILCSIVIGTITMTISVNHNENNRVIRDFPASLAITDLNEDNWSYWKNYIVQIDNMMKETYPLVFIHDNQRSDFYGPGGAFILSPLYNWLSDNSNLDYCAMYYALSNVAITNLLLDSGVFSIVGNGTVDKYSILVSEGTMFRHELEVGGNLTLFQKFIARNTSSNEFYETNSTQTYVVNGYLKLEKAEVFKSIFSEYFFIDFDEDDFNGDRSDRIRDFVLFDIDNYLTSVIDLFRDNSTGFIDESIVYRGQELYRALHTNYYVQLSNIHQILESSHPEEFLSKLSSLSSKLKMELESELEHSIAIFNLFQSEYLNYYQVSSTIIIVSLVISIPFLILGVYFVRTIVYMKLSQKKDFIRLLKRHGIPIRRISMLVIQEEILLGGFAGLFSLFPGLSLALAGNSILYPNYQFNYPLGIADLLWSTSIGLFIAIFISFYSYRFFNDIVPGENQTGDEEYLNDPLGDFDRLDQVILIIGFFPIIALLIEYTGLDCILPEILTTLINALFQYIGIILLISCPFLLSYSIVRFFLIKTRLFDILISTIADIFSRSTRFIVKASLSINRHQTNQILFVSCFSISMVIFPMIFINTTKIISNDQFQQEIGADIAIDIPSYRLYNDTIDLVNNYEFIESFSTIVKIRWYSEDISYHIFGIDPLSYLSTVDLDAIERYGCKVASIEELVNRNILFQEELLEYTFTPMFQNTTYNFRELRESGVNISDLAFINTGVFKSLPGILPRIDDIYKQEFNIINARETLIFYFVCNRDYLLSKINESVLFHPTFSFKTLIKIKPGFTDTLSLQMIQQLMKVDFEFCDVRFSTQIGQNSINNLNYLFHAFFSQYSWNNEVLNYMIVTVFNQVSLYSAILTSISLIGIGIIFFHFSWKKNEIYSLYNARGIQRSTFLKEVFSEYWSQGFIGICFGFVIGQIIGVVFTLGLFKVLLSADPFLSSIAFPISLISIDQLVFWILDVILLSLIILIIAFYFIIYFKKSLHIKNIE